MRGGRRGGEGQGTASGGASFPRPFRIPSSPHPSSLIPSPDHSAMQHPAAQAVQTGSWNLANIIRLDVCTESPVGEFAHV